MHLGQELAFIKGTSTRMGKVIYQLHRLLRLRKPLTSMAASPEVCNTRIDGEEILKVILDPDFWKKLVRFLVLTWPMHHLLRMTDFDKPIIGFVYPYIHDFLSHLRNYRDEGETEAIIYRIACKRLEGYCGDLHMCAYFLNPFYFDEVYSTTLDTGTPMVEMARKFFHHDEDVSEKVHKVMEQWAAYKVRGIYMWLHG